MEWLSGSEAEVWLKLLEYEGKFVKMRNIKKIVKTNALNKKLHDICQKGWIIRVKRGTYYISSFREVITGKMKPYRIKTLEDIRGLDIPLAVGAPANSEMYWYPVNKPQRVYTTKGYLSLIQTDFILEEMTGDMLKNTVAIGDLRMLSLEDTIVEALKDNDVQAAMAMAHRQKEMINWGYLTRRIKEEDVESLAYIALDRFPQAKVFNRAHKHDKLPILRDSFIKKVLRDNKIFAMTHGP